MTERSCFSRRATTLGLVTVVWAGGAFAAPARPGPPPPRRVRTIRPAVADVPNPAGLAYSPAADTFYLVQARPEDAPPQMATRIGMLTHFGEGIASASAGEEIRQPINTAFDHRANRLLFLDAATDEILALEVGRDRRPEPATATRSRIPQLHLETPKGITLDPVTGTLFVLDAGAGHIVRVAPSTRLDTPAAFGRAAVSYLPLEVKGDTDFSGIAFNPSDGHLYLFGSSGQRLHEVTPEGQLVGVRDLSSLRLVDPQGLVFAPSGDTTDDPSVLSLYVADTGLDPTAESGSEGGQPLGAVIEMSLTEPVEPPAAPQVFQSSLVNTIATSSFSPPSPDPSGLAYDTTRNRLLISDGEVEEMTIFQGVNVWETSLTGTVLNTGNTKTFFSYEPAGVAYNPANGHWFFSDDDANKVFEVVPGPDGRVGTADDTVTSFSTTAFGSGDAEGVTYDTTRGHLFIADGLNAEVYQVLPGANGRFDGVPPAGDDQTAHFDTAGLGLPDPEGVEYNPDDDMLYICGHGVKKILETTLTGTLVQEIDVSFLPSSALSGLAYAPASTNPSVKHLYIADRAVDNDPDPNENDGKVYEVTLPGEAPPPPDPNVKEVHVAASSDDAEEAASGGVSVINGDLELVFDGSNQTVGLRFNGLAIAQGAQIASAYVQFKVDEASSEATSITLRGQAADNPATFTATALDVSSRPRTSASVSWSPPAWTAVGEAGPNQRTTDIAPIIREIVGRPGWASGNSLVIILTGTGRRVAESYNGDAPGAPLLHVVLVPPPVNQPPSVSAGPDRTITLPSSAALDGTVSDDGLPNPPGTTTTTWSKVSGSGTVTFANASAVDTTATFSQSGIYVLRLTADDGVLRPSDDTTVTVNDPAPQSSVDVRVAGSADDAEESASGSVSVTNGDLELVFDVTDQTVGLRFRGVAIAKGAQIASAYVQFKVDEATSAATSLTLQGQAADNPPSFTTAGFNVSSRPRTAAFLRWSPPAWSTVGDAGPSQRTTNIGPIVQEIVKRSSWASGNSMVILLTGTGKRVAESFDGDAPGAPLLHVELGTPSNVPPSVNAGPDQKLNLPSGASLDGTVWDDGLPAPPGTTTTTWTKVSGPGTVTFANASAVDTTATFSAVGTYVLRLTANDGAQSASDDITITVNKPGTVEVRVAASSDDAEESATGSVSVSNGDLELVRDTSNQTVGLRFAGVAVPPGATIRNAYVQFKVDETSSELTALTLQGQAADSAPTFTTASFNVSSRPRTLAAAAWSPVTWTTVGQVGPNQQTPDLSAVIREIVSRPGWASGNSIVIVITGTGKRVAVSFDGEAAGAPLLHLEYE